MRLSIVGCGGALIGAACFVASSPALAQPDDAPPYNPPPVYGPPPGPPPSYTPSGYGPSYNYGAQGGYEQSARRGERERPVRFQIAPMIGYQVGGNVDVPGGSVDISDSPTYGGALDFMFRPGRVGLEVAYRLQDTHVDSNVGSVNSYELYGLTNSYFEIGPQFNWRFGHVTPYAGVSLGATLLAPHSPLVSDELHFLSSLYGGVKAMATQGVGIRAEAKLSSTYLSGSSTVLCSFGGCSYGFFGAGIWQFDFSVGPQFDL